MLRKCCCLLLVIGFFAVSADAAAAELVRFVDGRYLEIVSHTVKGKWITLNLKAGSTVGLPAGRVEKIEKGGLVVFPAITDKIEKRLETRLAMRGAVPTRGR